MAAVSNPPDVARLADLMPRPRWMQQWERRRRQNVPYIVECLAEAGGAFAYCFFGMGAAAAYVCGNILGLPGLGTVFSIGWGYGIGIVVALTVFGNTSAGHFAPAITITNCIWRGFPWKKAPGYIASQILGAYIGSIMVYGQWRNLIVDAEAVLTAAGTLEATLFTPEGPAGIFAVYATPGANMGFIFLNEFMTDFMIGILIWACVDPTNPFVAPSSAPWVIAMTYASIVWGFASPGLVANTARDLGGRLAAMTFWGRQASGGNYAALTALTNIPATILAATVYEFFFLDSGRIVPTGWREFAQGLEVKEQNKLMVTENSTTFVTGLEAASLGSEQREIKV